MVSRGWVFTVFDLENFAPIDECTTENAVKYGIYQLEECPSTGRMHIQGYYEFTRPVRKTHCQRVLNVPKAHCDPRHGSPDQARTYCLKEDTQATLPSEFGNLPGGQGQRNDLIAVFASLDEGATPQEIAQSYPATWARCLRAVDRYYLDIAPKRNWQMEVHVIVGEPDAGKTRSVYEQAESQGFDVFDVMSPNMTGGAIWFDGYKREHAILLDDFYGWLPWTFLLKLLDRYPMRIQTKGGVAPFLSHKVFITSNSHPNTWYNYGGHMQYAALERRITTLTLL